MNVPQAPKFAFCGVLSKDRKRAFQCFAHNSYDEGLAHAIVAFAREHDAELITPSERPLVVVEGFRHPRYGFDTLVAVSPTVHKYHADKPDIHRVIRAVFPAYRCEFRRGDPGASIVPVHRGIRRQADAVDPRAQPVPADAHAHGDRPRDPQARVRATAGTCA
jgi:hypothetical protein